MYLEAVDVIPPLYFSSSSILSLLNQLSSTHTQCYTIGSLISESETENQAIKSVIGYHTSVLKVDGRITNMYMLMNVNTY
jgi:hypothetical protein